jgi:hypothetical protein
VIHVHYSFFYSEFKVHVIKGNVFDILEEHIASTLWLEMMRMDDKWFCILNGVLGSDYVKNSPVKGWRRNESKNGKKGIRTLPIKEACKLQGSLHAN